MEFCFRRKVDLVATQIRAMARLTSGHGEAARPCPDLGEAEWPHRGRHPDLAVTQIWAMVRSTGTPGQGRSVSPMAGEVELVSRSRSPDRRPEKHIGEKRETKIKNYKEMNLK